MSELKQVMPVFQWLKRDRGNCRTYYTVKGDTNRPVKLYARYDGEDLMYTCSKDGEPDTPIGNTYYVVENLK